MSEQPVVLLWGESAFLLREAAQRVLGEARVPEIEADAWQPGRSSDLATPSLFGEARALLVSDLQGATPDTLDEIARYALEPNPEARLVLTCVVSARAKGPPAKVTKMLQGRATIRRVAVDRKSLPGWVAERAQARGVKATPAGVRALIETVGEDPALLDQSVAQLADALPEEGIVPGAVAAQFRGFGDRRIYELCDAAFTGNARDAVRYLTAMLEAREQPLAILGGIASRVRDLLRVRSLPPRMPPKDLARAAGLRFDWQARRYREQAARYRPEELVEIHRRVADADAVLKQGGQGDVVLAMLVGKISERAAGGR